MKDRGTGRVETGAGRQEQTGADRQEETGAGSREGAYVKSTESLGRLFWEFLKLGLFTIGGGMAMIPQMQRIAVEDNHWLTEEEVIDCIAVSQSLPGIVAINMATYIGRKMAGFWGALCATIGVAFPSFVIIILAVLLLDKVEHNPWVDGAFTGVKAAVCGLLIVTAISLGRQVIRTHVQFLLMLAALAAVAFGGINAVWVILAAALLGIVYTCTGSKNLGAGDEGRED